MAATMDRQDIDCWPVISINDGCVNAKYNPANIEPEYWIILSIYQLSSTYRAFDIFNGHQ